MKRFTIDTTKVVKWVSAYKSQLDLIHFEVIGICFQSVDFEMHHQPVCLTNYVLIIKFCVKGIVYFI